jgi:hypothetical protein
MSTYRKDQRVKVVRVIHRSSGSAWPDEVGVIVAVTGDGYKVRFSGGFVADLVKDADIQQA